MSMSKRLSLLCLAPLLLLAPACGGPDEIELFELEAAEQVAQLRIDSDSGDVRVVTEPGRDRVEIEAGIYGDQTSPRWVFDDGVLKLDHRCGGAAWRRCSVDWTVRLPATDGDGEPARVDLEVVIGSGNLTVKDLIGDIEANTDSGNVDIRRVRATYLQLDTGSGNVNVSDCEADSVSSDAGSGNISIGLDAIPRDVSLAAGSGNVGLTVPRARYRLDLRTKSGNVDVDGLSNDPDADNAIAINAGSGNIRVRGR